MKKEMPESKYSFYRSVKLLLPNILRFIPIAVSINIVLFISLGLTQGMIIITQQRFFDNAVMLENNRDLLNATLYSLVFLCLTYLANQLINAVIGSNTNYMANKHSSRLTYKIHEKTAKLLPSDFNDTEKLNAIDKAEYGKNYAFWFMHSFNTILFYQVPFFIFIGLYLYSLKPTLILTLLFTFIPVAVAQFVKSRIYAKMEDASAPLRRQKDHYETCITGRDMYKETRVLGAYHFFKTLYLATIDALHFINFKAVRKSDKAELMLRMLTVIGYFGVLYLLFDALLSNEISIGAFAAVFNSVGMVFSNLEYLFSGSLAEMTSHLGMIKNYINFLHLKEREGKENISPEWGEIEIKNASYTYPNSEKRAVNNVSFTIKKGKTVAVVGENGSGKSTLTRLVSGLYLPDSGDVIMAGKNTKDLTADALFKNTSAVFQSFIKYKMTMRENIRISDVQKKYTDGTLDDACAKSGLSEVISNLDNGYDTILSREFDGTDLSGGQWQRVAVARALFRDFNFIILDEPTAAIDPFEETRMYNRFTELTKGKTAMIVTHRLGSVRLADRILVMKEGSLVQNGTHDQLMTDENGEYKRLYKAQEQWYVREKQAEAGIN